MADTNTTTQHPTPVFKRGQMVAHKSRPRQALHIYADPYWSVEHHQWLYPYDYNLGLTSEGVGLETSLMPAPKNSVL